MDTETLEQAQARHRKELKDLQGRITNKKKNATKKTRKGVNDECAELERQLKEKQAAEIAALSGETTTQDIEDDEDETQPSEPLEETTAKMTISEPQPETDTAQAPGKKRNRQKERLARRAAEQEAEAIKAEEEAANMTDFRAKESEYMKTEFEKNGLVEQEIAPDGHCLFSAVADQLSQHDIPIDGTGLPYKKIRAAASSFMADNADDFAPFLEEDFDSYVAKMRDTAEWGGQLELTALARKYNVGIKVVQDGRTEVIGEGDKTLWLAYYRHGYGLGEHYNSLRKK